MIYFQCSVSLPIEAKPMAVYIGQTTSDIPTRLDRHSNEKELLEG